MLANLTVQGAYDFSIPPLPSTHTLGKSAAGRLRCRTAAGKYMLTCELHVAPGLRPARVGLCLAPDVLDLQEWAHSHKHTWYEIVMSLSCNAPGQVSPFSNKPQVDSSRVTSQISTHQLMAQQHLESRHADLASCSGTVARL